MKAKVAASNPWLRVRAAPSLSAAVIGTVPDGVEIEIDSLVRASSGAAQWASVAARLGNLPLTTEAGAPVCWYLSAQWLQIEQPQQPPPPASGEIVGVPWFSQVGNPYSNDCGPACWAMLAGWAGRTATVDALVRLMRVANQLTSTDTAVACWKALKLGAEKGAQIVTPPFLCLVDYPALPERYITYPYQHWVVVVGVERDGAGNIVNVIYHDPLWPEAGQGAYKRIGVGQFHAAEHGVHNRARCRPVAPAM